jgi:hypothetical protein
VRADATDDGRLCPRRLDRLADHLQRLLRCFAATMTLPSTPFRLAEALWNPSSTTASDFGAIWHRKRGPTRRQALNLAVDRARRWPRIVATPAG